MFQDDGVMQEDALFNISDRFIDQLSEDVSFQRALQELSISANDIKMKLREHKLIYDRNKYKSVSKGPRVRAKRAREKVYDESYYFDIIEDTHPTNWMDDGYHCIVYDGNNPYGIPYGFCGTHIPEGGRVCTKHSVKSSGKKILRSIEDGTFQSDRYYDKKINARKTAARIAIKKHNIDHLNIRCMEDKKKVRKVLQSYSLDNVYRYRPNGLLVRIVPGEEFPITLGKDVDGSGTITKLNIGDIRSLKGWDIIVMTETINYLAYKYVESRIS